MDQIFGLDKHRLTDKKLVRCFDVDGVLMTYAYGTNGIYAYRNDKFQEYLKTNNIYKTATAPLLIKEYIDNCTIKENNFVITKVYTDTEFEYKRAAIMEKYPNKFDESQIFSVKCNEHKASLMQYFADIKNVGENGIVMIDDSLEVLDKVETLRMQDKRLMTLHISSFLNIKDWTK